MKIEGYDTTLNFKGFLLVKVNNIIWIINEPEKDSHKCAVLLISHTRSNISNIIKVLSYKTLLQQEEENGWRENGRYRQSTLLQTSKPHYKYKINKKKINTIHMIKFYARGNKLCWFLCAAYYITWLIITVLKTFGMDWQTVAWAAQTACWRYN